MTQPIEQPEQQAKPVVWNYREVQIDDVDYFHTEEPVKPEVGDHWYNPENERLCVWDGYEWDLVPND